MKCTPCHGPAGDRRKPAIAARRSSPGSGAEQQRIPPAGESLAFSRKKPFLSCRPREKIEITDRAP